MTRPWLKAALASGWVPTAAVALLLVALWNARGVDLWEISKFAVYEVAGVITPGVLCWRCLRCIGTSRLWLEDAVFGAILGYAIEIPTYVVSRALGAPLLVLIWPAAVYVLTISTRAGRALWRNDATRRVSPAWSWTMSCIVIYLILFVARATWWQNGLDLKGLRAIGPDASFQLGMVGELKHHVPPQVPWLAGEPMHYHWLYYAHVASASWLTHIEPIILLRRLDPVPLMLLIVLAAALTVERLAVRPNLGLLAGFLLVVVHSPALDPSARDMFQRQEFTSQAIFGSPTLTFGAMFFAGALLLILELLQRPQPPWTWVTLGLLIASASGSKATFGPMIVAGLVAVVLVQKACGRALRHHYALVGLAVLVWLIFQLGFYARDSGGTRFSLSGTARIVAGEMGIANASVSILPVVVGATVLLWAVHMGGIVGLIPGGVWRDSRVACLFGIIASGLGAAILLDIPGFSQQWFVSSTQIPAAVGAAWGFSRIAPPRLVRPMLPWALTAGLVGAAGTSLAWGTASSRSSTAGDSDVLQLWRYGGGFFLIVLIVGLFGALLYLLPIRGVPPIAVSVVFLASALTGIGTFRTAQLVTALAHVPWHPARASRTNLPVGTGGIATARWLRAHSDPSDVVATNGHTMTPRMHDVRVFWLAAYSERRVLVEGWGYSPEQNARVSSTGLPYNDVPFWDHRELLANDAAFDHPSLSDVADLRRRYGVDWLVLDKRFGGDPAKLASIASRSFGRGVYVVYDLR